MALDHLIEQTLTYCLPSTSVRDVAEAMREDGVGAVIVVEKGVPKGVITDRDIVMRCLLERRDSESTRADEIMTAGVETIRSDRDIYDVAERMRAGGVRRVVVVDEADNAVGVLSFDDVFDLLGEELENLREAVHPRRRRGERHAA